MSGSNPKNEQETEADLPSTVDQVSLVGFLAPPARTRSSAPPSAGAEEEKGRASGAEAPSKASAAPEAPPSIAPSGSARAETPRQVEGTPSSKVPGSDGAARSLIPVETAGSSASDDEGLYQVPAPVFSAANFRRFAIAVTVAAAIGGAAWVARRPPATATLDSGAAPKAVAAAPAAEPPRTIEADENAGALAAPAESAAPAALDPVKGLEFRQKARQLLENGQIDQGVTFARRAIEANPADPECYVLLAAGLQDQGRWQESREVFSKCVNRSKTGINSECAYFATAGTTTQK